MNPGVGEETAKTAAAAIDAMRSTPILLMILLFNIMFMGLTGWLAHTNGTRFERTMELALKACGDAK